MRTALGALLLSAFLLGCADAPVTSPAARSRLSTPAFARATSGATHIAFIAGKPAGRAMAAAARLGIRPSTIYRAALDGFAATLTPEDSVALVAAGVVVETNHILTADPLVGIDRVPLSWGQDRIDQRTLPLDNAYVNYPNEGAGVHVYVIDTNLDITHPEFGGRASNGFDAIDGTFPKDCHYHATHVAGTIGGNTVGLANQVSIVSVRVLSCGGSGSSEQVAAGIDWVTANAIHPAVANMSLGGYIGFPVTCENEAIAVALCNSVASGITYAVAAGNSNTDACVSTPSGAPPALTVGATLITGFGADYRSSFSSSGPCMDLFAPGQDIWSSMPNDAYAYLSGTSMASPHVAGHAAQLLSANPAWTPAQVMVDIIARATPNVVNDPGLGGTPNLLLYTATGSIPPPPPPPPGDDASFSAGCSGYTCTFAATQDGSWDFGDGTTGTGINVTHVFAARGRYTVRHTVGSAASATTVRCNPHQCRA